MTPSLLIVRLLRPSEVIAVDSLKSKKSAEGSQTAWGLALSVGFQLMVSVLTGVFAGRWLDARLSAGPWFMVGGAFLGITVGLYQLIRAGTQR